MSLVYCTGYTEFPLLHSHSSSLSVARSLSLRLATHKPARHTHASHCLIPRLHVQQQRKFHNICGKTIAGVKVLSPKKTILLRILALFKVDMRVYTCVSHKQVDASARPLSFWLINTLRHAWLGFHDIHPTPSKSYEESSLRPGLAQKQPSLCLSSSKKIMICAVRHSTSSPSADATELTPSWKHINPQSPLKWATFTLWLNAAQRHPNLQSQIPGDKMTRRTQKTTPSSTRQPLFIITPVFKHMFSL